MIKTFRSKALKLYWTTGNGSKLPVQDHGRVGRILNALDAATAPSDMDLPGFKFHQLQGKPLRYSVWASGNYRVTFEWEQPDALKVDLEDYH